MGHNLLKGLPRTRRWREVIQLLELGAGVDDLASAVMIASARGFETAGSDEALAYSFWLLTQLPQAAKARTQREFAENLRKLGMDVESAPTAVGLTTAFIEAVDRQIEFKGGRTDLGEMAQMAAAECLLAATREVKGDLFASRADATRRGLVEYTKSHHFSQLAKDFFARLTQRYLTYFLSREASNYVGPNRRFANISEHIEFNEALDLHSRQAARIVEKFAEDWHAKNASGEAITARKAAGFAYVALNKLRRELTREGSAFGERT